jgi:CMP-N-acetylneuraminic acid synthetase
VNNLCYIQARAGSKRFPRKNMAKWNGIPMLADAIVKAQRTELFEQVVVSSDDPEMLELAANYNAMPIWRSKEAATDSATDDDVAKDVLRHFPGVNIICKLYPCIPLINPSDIRAAYMKMIKMDSRIDGIYSTDASGKDAGAFYIFKRYAYERNMTVSLDRFPWHKHMLMVCQDINTEQDLEEAMRKANL